jgi:hypothetical protein
MAYETGTASSNADLLDKIKLFLENNGWTTNRYDTQSTGKRLQMVKSSFYVNLRSFNNEICPGGSWAITGIGMNLSTGYSAGSDWYNQAGAPNAASIYKIVTMQRHTGAIPSYHFFCWDTIVYLIVEYSAGAYNRMGWGILDKEGTYTGGEFMFANWNQDGSNGSSEAITKVGIIGSAGVQDAAHGVVKVDADGLNDWRYGNGISGAPSGRSALIDPIRLYYYLLNQTPNQSTSISLLLPLRVALFRDTANNYSSSTYSILGTFPNIFFINIKNLNPGQTFTVGADTYKVFPFSVKNSYTSFPTTATTHSANLGIAVKTN